MVAVDLPRGRGLGLTGAQNWVALVEACALKFAKNWISANDAQIRHPYRKHTLGWGAAA